MVKKKKKKKIIFCGTKRPMTLKHGMQHWEHKNYQVYSNGDPGMTLPYFTTGSNLLPYAFVWEKGKTMDFFFFSENIVVYDIKVGRRSQLNEYMKFYEYQRSRSFIDLDPNHSDLIVLNLFSSITTGPIEIKFYVESPWDEGTKAC